MKPSALPEPSAIDDVTARVRAALDGRVDVGLAILFGSYARGTATDSSDVDVAVLAPGVDLSRLSGELSLALGTEVDVVSLALGSVPIPLLDRVIQEGVVVHEGARGAHATWRSAALSMLDLDLPWYRHMRDAWLARVAREGLADGQR